MWSPQIISPLSRSRSDLSFGRRKIYWRYWLYADSFMIIGLRNLRLTPIGSAWLIAIGSRQTISSAWMKRWEFNLLFPTTDSWVKLTSRVLQTRFEVLLTCFSSSMSSLLAHYSLVTIGLLWKWMSAWVQLNFELWWNVIYNWNFLKLQKSQKKRFA